MNKIFLLFILFHIVGVLTSQNVNRPAPKHVSPYEFIIHDSTFKEEYLATPLSIASQKLDYKSSMVVLDSLGYVLWYKTSDTSNYTNFQYYRSQKLFSVSEGLYFKVIDSNFVVIDSIKASNGYSSDTHEFIVLDNGNYLISGKSDSVVDLSNYNFKGVPGSQNTHLVGFTIQEFDPNHNLLFDWNSNDHLNPLESYDSIYGYNPNAFDYCHGNSIEKDFDGNYLVSLRHFNAIFKIGKNNGNVIWKLGGKDSDFTFLNDAGFSGQHDCRRLLNGNISLFNNANSGNLPRISKPKEYVLDTINMVAEKVWDYSYFPPFFARAMGNNQRKTNDYKTVGYGLIYRPNPSFVVLDSSDQLVSELFFKDSVVSYRSTSYKINLDWKRPRIKCTYLNGTLTLHAPGGQNKYAWSTGETTPGIIVSAVGEYQVWVNSGIGMLGSYPVDVTDISLYCNSTGIEEIKLKNEKKVIAIYDIMGRSTRIRESNTLYIIQYSDGSIEKRILLD